MKNGSKLTGILLIALGILLCVTGAFIGGVLFIIAGIISLLANTGTAKQQSNNYTPPAYNPPVHSHPVNQAPGSVPVPNRSTIRNNRPGNSTEEYFYGLLTSNFPGYTVHRNMPVSAPAASGNWKCGCGVENSGKFCVACGTPRPASNEWTCSCGTRNTGKFCPNCGSQKQSGTVAPMDGNCEKATFVLRQNGQDKVVILLVPKHRWNTAAIRNTMKACRASGIPCLRFMLEFRNDANYVIDRINSVLR